MSKLLLYCTKAKPYLLNQNVYEFYDSKYITSNLKCHEKYDYILNGKIVAECDFEVEEITYAPNPSEFDKCYFSPREWCYDYQEKYGGLSNEELLKHSCLTNKELSDYLNTPTNDKKTFCKDTFGYAIHIKNLHIFDSPKELSEFTTFTDFGKPITKAPQNMMYAFDNEGNKYIVISIQSQWMCLILNHIKDVEVRRAVLKEMLKNE